MKNILIIYFILFSTICFSQAKTVTINIYNSETVTQYRNGKDEINTWKLENESKLTFNGNTYPFVKDKGASSLTKLVGWVTIEPVKYRVVFYYSITSITIYKNDKVINRFD